MKYCGTFWLCIFTVSILFNLLTLINLSSQPTYKLGVLLQDVEVVNFFSDRSKVLFKLPKGMIIRNASPRGIASAGLFGPDRFTFTIIGYGSDLIDYSGSDAISPTGALYETQ